MFMKLDDIDLIKKKDDGGDVSEIRSVHDVRVSGRRHIVELRVPGARHNIFQDMGREPITISFEGRIVGKEAEGTVDLLEERLEKNEALPFETDLASLKNVSEVVIASMDIRFVGGVANAVDYSITLREHRPESKGGKGEGKSKGKGKGGEGEGGEGAPGQKGGKEDAQKKMKEAKEESTKSGGGGEGEGGTGSAADAKGSGSSPSKPSGDAEQASAGRGGGEVKDAAGSDMEGTPPPPPPEGDAAQSGGKEQHAAAEGASGMGGKPGVTEQEGRKE